MLNINKIYNEDCLEGMKKIDDNMIDLCKKIYKNTISYELDGIRVNDDGTTTHIHSDRFLDEHPERKNSPEFTPDEENEYDLRFLQIVYRLCALEDFINKKYIFGV